MVYEFQRPQSPPAGHLVPRFQHRTIATLAWARRNSESLCSAVSSVDVTTFMPFAGRTPTGEPDTCPSWIVTGNRICVPNHIALPRGYLSEVVELFEEHGIKTDIRDERVAGHPIDVEFSGQLRPLQKDAVSIKPEITITFADPLAMVEVLTAERLGLVQKVRTQPSSITALAAALKRDPKSVRRDVLKLERAGVVRTRQQINPGHGRVKIVEPVAREYRLTAVL